MLLPPRPLSPQDAVARLCSSWWSLGAEGRESLVSQTLPYLLVKALSAGETGSRGGRRPSFNQTYNCTNITHKGVIKILSEL